MLKHFLRGLISLKQLVCVLCFSALALSTGCATIITGGSQDVSFQSTPEGATVFVDDQVVGKTPLMVKLHRKKNPPLRFEMEGYKTIDTQVKSVMEPWLMGNIIFGGVIGSTIDSCSGAVHQYSPNEYHVMMTPVDSEALSADMHSKVKIKEFVIIAYKNIIQEFSEGHGEYLSSLLSMLEIEPGENDAVIEKIKSLSEQYPEIPVFAEQVSELTITNT